MCAATAEGTIGGFDDPHCKAERRDTSSVVDRPQQQLPEQATRLPEQATRLPEQAIRYAPSLRPNSPTQSNHDSSVKVSILGVVATHGHHSVKHCGCPSWVHTLALIFSCRGDVASVVEMARAVSIDRPFSAPHTIKPGRTALDEIKLPAWWPLTPEVCS